MSQLQEALILSTETNDLPLPPTNGVDFEGVDQILSAWAGLSPDAGWDAGSRAQLDLWRIEDEARAKAWQRQSDSFRQQVVGINAEFEVRRLVAPDLLGLAALKGDDLVYSAADVDTAIYPTEIKTVAHPSSDSSQLVLRGIRKNLGSSPEDPYAELDPRKLTNQEYSDMFHALRAEALAQCRAERGYLSRTFNFKARKHDKRVADLSARLIMDGTDFDNRMVGDVELLPPSNSLRSKIRTLVMADIPAIIGYGARLAKDSLGAVFSANDLGVIDQKPGRVATVLDKVDSSTMSLAARAYGVLFGDRSPKYKWGVAGVALIAVTGLNRVFVDNVLPGPDVFEDLAHGLVENS